MGALAPVTPWLPEDDLLLKNAVEAGASLESLAKGAVQFSRRFTVRELQERWHSLLYDPVVSADASFHMSELERSNPHFPTKFGRAGNSKENKSSCGKRSAERVRNSYYELRKKFRNEPFNSMDLSFLVPPNDSHYIGNENEPHLGFEESHLDIIHNAFPEILGDGGCVVTRGSGPHGLHAGFQNSTEDDNTMQKDNAPNEVPPMVGDSVASRENPGTSGSNTVRDDSKLKLPVACHESKSAMPITDSYLAELSNTLLNDVDHFMDVDGKDMIDKSYYDGLSSLLVHSADSATKDHMPNAMEPEPSTAPIHVKDVSLDDNKMSEFGGTNAASTSNGQAVSDAPAWDPHPEIVNGVICCTLNTEDLEIPCNDGIFTSNQCHPLSVSSLAKRNFKDFGNSVSTSTRDLSANKDRNEGYFIPMQKKNNGQSHGSSQKMPEMGQASEHRVKFEFSSTPGISCGGSTRTNAVRVSSKTPLPITLKDEAKEITSMKHSIEKPSIGFDAYGSYPLKDVGASKSVQDILAVTENPHASNAEYDSVDIAGSETEINPILEEDPIESDDDLPNYSDIEAMILDMDLDPDDQDIYAQEVSKYQHEDAKRKIIRLEQAANSYMQRAMVSHGAFAVLYGRYSKHYIKKPEVLLGRSTEDFAVDIDLGREKHGNKVSRRQAIIWLDKDGSFRMKNLGKYPVSVNDKEVDPGHTLTLSSDCLIEIRGMPFVFETCHSRIKHHLDSMN